MLETKQDHIQNINTELRIQNSVETLLLLCLNQSVRHIFINSIIS
jgi:hypothetical protein